MTNVDVKILPFKDATAISDATIVPSIRFSCFPVDVCQGEDGDDIADFERKYECGSKLCAPALWELQQSQKTYRIFRNSSIIHMTPGDTEFWDVVRKSQSNVVYFLDPHFEKKNLARLYALATELEESLERRTREFVVLTTSNGRDKDDEIRKFFVERCNETRGWKYLSLTFCILDNGHAELMHDRFVLLDGYIWHFGSSAGAMHESLTAYTGPWKDCSGSFQNLINDLIRYNRKPRMFSSRGIPQ